MRVKSTIVITSGRSQTLGTSALDHAIKKLRELGQEQLTIVLGPDGDEFLASCSLLETCDIIFDPNFEGGFFSGVKSGATVATAQASFVMPLEAEIADERIWRELDTALLKAQTQETKPHVFRVVTHEGNGAVFPQLITVPGQRAFMSLPASTDWENLDPATVQTVPQPHAEAA